MDKKGGGHVDWIISIGIFLIYLLSMFVLIKPGIIPTHDSDTLLDIIEENVREDFFVALSFDNDPTNDDVGGFYWTLNKLPLFVNSFHLSIQTS